jgi:flagellar protein FlbT
MKRPGPSPIRAFIKRGARFFLNGALMRASDSVTVEIHAADVLLMPSHLIEPEAVRTPLEQLYYCVQQMLIEPERRSYWHDALREGLDAGLAADQREALKPVLYLVERDRLQSAMAQLRKLIRVDRETSSAA